MRDLIGFLGLAGVAVLAGAFWLVWVEGAARTIEGAGFYVGPNTALLLAAAWVLLSLRTTCRWGERIARWVDRDDD